MSLESGAGDAYFAVGYPRDQVALLLLVLAGEGCGRGGCYSWGIWIRDFIIIFVWGG